MNGRQRLALEELVRSTVARDLDQLAGEIGRLRQEIVSLEKLCGLPGEPVGQRERRARVTELRARGYSTRAIAQLVHSDRGTVMKDVRALGLPPAPVVIGLDGRAVRGPRAQPSA